MCEASLQTSFPVSVHLGLMLNSSPHIVDRIVLVQIPRFKSSHFMDEYPVRHARSLVRATLLRHLIKFCLSSCRVPRGIFQRASASPGISLQCCDSWWTRGFSMTTALWLFCNWLKSDLSLLIFRAALRSKMLLTVAGHVPNSMQSFLQPVCNMLCLRNNIVFSL